MATKKQLEEQVIEPVAEETTEVIPSDDGGETTGSNLDEMISAMENAGDGEQEDQLEPEPESESELEPEPIEPDTNPPDTPKPKRTRKKKTEESELPPAEDVSVSSEDTKNPGEVVPDPATSKEQAPPPAKRSVRKRPPSVLTIDSRAEIETQEVRDDVIWHEIRNAHRTRRILTGTLGGIEQTDTGKSIAVVSYKELRIIIPVKEMMINLTRTPTGQEYDDMMLRQNKILGNMLGAEIDFIVKGIDSKSRTAVASRKEAMLKKRQLFYLNEDTSGQARIYQGRVVQARVIAVAEKVVRIEVFGVECSIMARDLSWDWLGDAHERFNVGDEILVRLLSVAGDKPEDISIKADVKSVTEDTSQENLKKCRVQSKYVGTVTDVYKGVVFIRLSNGANAIAHSCYDRRMPGKKDEVGFAVTRIDAERGAAVGIITRIIKQNL